jgi:DNA-binding HxlR family transcriptional regulator
MAKTKTYGHYCAAARSLEVIGDKWSLLIVRDLLAGAQRFSDLLGSLRAITPKLLTLRLRELEAAGVLERDEEPGRREVRYGLTPAGMALRPVITELLIWGVDHAEPPTPSDTISARRAGNSFAAVLNRRQVKPAHPVRWQLRFDPETTAFLRFDGERWSPEPVPAGDPELVIDARADQWVAMFRAEGADRDAHLAEMRLSGEPEAAQEFARLHSAEHTAMV